MKEKVLAFIVYFPFSASETFFARDIEVIEKLGWKVKLFSNYSDLKTTKFFHQGLVKKVSFKGWVHNFSILFSSLFILGKIRKAYQLTPAPNRLYKVFKSVHILLHDVNHVHYGFGSVALDREWLAEVLGAKMSVSFRGIDMGLYPLSNENIYNNLWGKTDFVHFVSNGLKNRAIDWTKFDAIYKRESVVCNDVVDFDLLDSIGPKEEFIDNEKISIVAVTRTHWVKGLKSLLLVAHELKLKEVKFDITVIGVKEIDLETKYMLNDLNIKNQVSFIGGLSHELTLKEIKKHDLFVSTSVQEGFGVSLLESQFLGIIPFAYDVGGISENIEDEKTGYLAPKYNHVKMADLIYDFISKPIEQKQEMVKYSHKRIKESLKTDYLLGLWNKVLVE